MAFGNKSRHGKKRPQRDLSGVLYTARKRSNYNDALPEKEAKKANPFTALGEKLRSRISHGQFEEREKKPSLGTRFKEKTAAALDAGAQALSDAHFFIVLIVCVAASIIAFVSTPTALATEVKTVNILDSGRTFAADTTADTVGELLSNNNIVIGEDDYLETPADTALTDGMDVIIRRAMTLNVRTGNQLRTVSMIAGTVDDALAEAGIMLDEDDEVYPSPDTFVRSGMTIDHIIVDTEYETTTRVLGYQEETREDSSMYEGDSDIVQYGEEGEMEITTAITYKNGARYSEEVISETVTKEPVNEITAIGTKVKKKASSSGSSAKKPSSSSGGTAPDGSSVREVLALECTAYCDSATATGNYPGHGTVAANPSIFPYGTRLYIEGYGYGVVQDTGGFASSKPYNLDLWMSSDGECNAWGRRTVTVYVLN